jgi:pimeloyl-ACP methyl ester carboxylesterase
MNDQFRANGLGVLGATAAAVLLTVATASAQVQSSAQAGCITGLNKAGAKVAKSQGKVDGKCAKGAAKGIEPDADACSLADPSGKVGKAQAKVDSVFASSCGTLPGFGPVSASAVSASHADGMRSVNTTLFGSMNSALVLSGTDSAGAKCQAAVLKNSQKIVSQILKDFTACKSDGLKAGTLASEFDLADCLDTVDADAKGKLAAATAGLTDALSSTCAGLDVNALFPADCSGHTNFSECVLSLARCNACTALAGSDEIARRCDRFDDDMPANGSCSGSTIVGVRESIPATAQPAHTPGSLAVVVTNPKLLTQFPPAGPDLNRADYVRWRLNESPETAPDAILILVPGFGAGVNTFRILAEDLIPKIYVDKGIRLEIWGFSRRDDRLEDREGSRIAADNEDPSIALDWFWGTELGLTLHPELVSGPNRRAVFYNTSDDIPFLADFTPQMFSLDIDDVVELAKTVTPNVFLGGHSAGTGFTARYAATDFNLSGVGPAEPGYAKLRGLILLEGGGGTTAYSSPLSPDTLARVQAKNDGGLFHAVRDNAPRCTDGTACTIATEAVDCGHLPNNKCTPPTTSYSALGGLKPDMYAAGEVGATQGLTDPDKGRVILQVDQGSPGNNAVDVVPGLSPLASLANMTVDGLFGTFLDDEGVGVLLSPALGTSLGAQGPNVGGNFTWLDIDGDGLIPASARPNNGPAPTSLPASVWGQEVEVTRMDRHRNGFITDGENASDWYYAGSGLSTLSVTGVCSLGTCTVGKAGSCSTNAECSQSVNLDSSALVALGREDIANSTQAANIDIPVISFGGSNGLTPVGASFLGFGQSIGTCTAPSCDGSTARVVDAALPNPAFPTYGNVAGGYEVYISEGYHHVDVVTAEDTEANLVPERIQDFIDRNMTP